jgi:hypothetical protein
LDGTEIRDVLAKEGLLGRYLTTVPTGQ